MASSIEMSLDDIIQKKFKRTNIRGRGGTRRGRPQKRLESRRGQVKNADNSERDGRRGGGRGRGRGNNSRISDARLRIIQKNRQKLTDARDKLVEMAKKSDARLKLEKLRESRMQGNVGVKQPRPGINITRRTGRNGQITLSTNRRPGLSSERQVTRRLLRTTTGRGIPRDLDFPQEDVPGAVRRIVANDILSPHDSYSRIGLLEQALLPDLDDDDLSDEPITLPSTVTGLRRSLTQPARLKITAHTVPPLKHQSPRDDWLFDDRDGIRGHGRIDLDDSDDDGAFRRPTSFRRGGSVGLQLSGKMSSELKARLDTPPVVPRTMGILSSSSGSTSVAPPAPTGHRIVVSNLHTTVTQEDIRELFEDIGPLVSSKLVRPGTAEVVYREHKDAVQAVDVYHNRQLDGQPMKCMLVNSRPPNITASSRGSGSGMRSASSSSSTATSGGKSSLVPDINTIHKALFNKK